MNSEQQPDFSVQIGDTVAKAVLEWRGTPHAFWAVHVGWRGPFRPAVELDMNQARAVAEAVAEFDRRIVILSHQNDHS